MAVDRVRNRTAARPSNRERAVPARDARRPSRDRASLLALALLAAGTAIFLTHTESVEGVYMAVHVVSVTVWVGGAVALLILALRTERTREPRAVANLMRHIMRTGERVFTPASLLALGSGIALVQKQGGGYGRFWIDFGLAVWALSFVFGAAYIGPTSKKLVTLIPERGVEDPTAATKLTTLLRVARFDAAMLVLVVVDMAAQPTF